ncbi:hypothetical protein ACC754_44485, partial [Rhizobium johnstonii]
LGDPAGVDDDVHVFLCDRKRLQEYRLHFDALGAAFESLTANNNKVEAVVASNDGTAGGAIADLEAKGLAGSVPVSG